MGETTFSNFQEVFHWFLQNYTNFAHEISHIKPSKYDSTFGTKISMFEKSWGMRLWIGTSTFKLQYSKVLWAFPFSIQSNLIYMYLSVNTAKFCNLLKNDCLAFAQWLHIFLSVSFYMQLKQRPRKNPHSTDTEICINLK